MNTHNISDKELIDRFLNQSLSKDEKLKFNERKNDPIFLDKLEKSIIEYGGRVELRNKLKTIGNKIKKEEPYAYRFNKKLIKSIGIGIAASILLFFTFQFFFIKKTDTDDLFNSYFETYPNLYVSKGEVEQKDTLITEAFEFYDKEQYIQTTITFKKIKTKRGLSSLEHFYYGISLLAIDEVKKL